MSNLQRILIGLRAAVFLALSGCSTHYSNSPNALVPPPPAIVEKKSSSKPEVYVVKRGDSLSAIGRRFGISYQMLAKWNGIVAPYRIYVGRTLRLFPPKQSLGAMPNNRAEVDITQKKRGYPQKKSTISIDNTNILKLYWHWPLKGSILKTYSVNGNKGIDIAGWVGETVRAAAAGKVVYSGNGLVGYGNLLIIKHNDEYLSAYANNGKLLVTEGVEVVQGQAIAEVGGVGSRAYLHFEIRKKGSPVDPVKYLPEK